MAVICIILHITFTSVHETLASPVLHIQIIASIKGNSAEDELA